jgi:hypothetical protein
MGLFLSMENFVFEEKKILDSSNDACVVGKPNSYR